MASHDNRDRKQRSIRSKGGLSPKDRMRLFRRPKLSLASRLRNNFLTGLVIVGPITITIYIVWWFIDLIDSWAKPIIDSSVKPILNNWVRPFLPEDYVPDLLPFTVPGLGLLFMVLLIIVIGALAANLLGRSVVGWGEGVLGRMPVVRSLYKATKQIFETVLSQRGTSFQKVGLVEYPRRGLYAIVFISTETTGEIKERIDDGTGLISVFLPTTPNPTSGFLLFVPRNEVIMLEMTVEEAAKLVISAGLVVPDYQKELGQLAADARPSPAQPQQS